MFLLFIFYYFYHYYFIFYCFDYLFIEFTHWNFHIALSFNKKEYCTPTWEDKTFLLTITAYIQQVSRRILLFWSPKHTLRFGSSLESFVIGCCFIAEDDAVFLVQNCSDVCDRRKVFPLNQSSSTFGLRVCPLDQSEQGAQDWAA